MRVWCMGAPPSMAGGALMPGMPITARATTYRQVRIIGQPGTAAIPAPKPAGLPMVAQTRGPQPSWSSPDYVYPSIYVALADNMHPPVGLQRDNQMPVPAKGNFGGVGRIAPTSFKRRGTGGQTQIDWPAVVQRFPNRFGGLNG